MRRRIAAAVTVLLLGVACDTAADPGQASTPSPSPAPPAETEPVTGLQVGIVLPPATSGLAAVEASALVRAADRLADDPGLDVRDARSIQAPTADFHREALALLAERGAGLVCAVGSEGAQDLLAVADAYPRTRFCLLAGELTDPPRNVFAVSWEQDAATGVLGAAAAFTAPAVPDAPPAQVRIVTAGVEDPGAFRDAVLSVARRFRGAIDVTAVPVRRDATAQEVHEAVVRSLDESPPGAVLVAAGGVDVAAGVLDAASEVRGLVLGWSVPPASVLGEEEGEGDERVVVSVVRRFDVALRLAVRHVAGDVPAPEPLTLADGYALVPGAHSRWASIRSRLERYVADLAGEEPVVLEPPAPSPTE